MLDEELEEVLDEVVLDLDEFVVMDGSDVEKICEDELVNEVVLEVVFE